MMAIAFVIGLLLQLLVIEVPAVRNVFSTENLNTTEWLFTALLSLIPLIIHEIIVLIRWISKKSIKQ